MNAKALRSPNALSIKMIGGGGGARSARIQPAWNVAELSNANGAVFPALFAASITGAGRGKTVGF